MSGQSPMPPSARRAGLEALRNVLRRRHPGYDVIFEVGRRHDGDRRSSAASKQLERAGT